MYDVVIVGGGIVGASVVYHMVRDDFDVLLVDRDDEGRATRAGAGILCPTASSRSESDEWYEFAIDAVRYYTDLEARLRAEQSEPTGYAQTGLLAVATDDDEINPFERSLARARDRSEAYPEKESTVEEVTPAEAVDRCRALARPQRAYVVKEGARVNGDQFANALLRAAQNRGLDVARENVVDIAVDDGLVTGVITEDERYNT